MIFFTASKGRKRPIVIDAIVYIIVVRVHAATIHDSRAARAVLAAFFSIVDTIKKICADGGYKGEEFMQWVKEKFDCIFEVVKKKKTGKGFQVLPRRWVVERTVAWLGRSRRLSKDDERKTTSSEGQVYIASSRLMLRRICKERSLLKEATLAPA